MDKLSLIDILFKNDEQSNGDASMLKNGFFSRQFSGAVTKKLKRILSTRPFRFIDSLSYLISHASTIAYGSCLITFGIVSVLIYLLRLSADDSLITPIIGVVLSLIAIPYLFADKPLPLYLADFPITDYLFYEILCMKRHTTESSVKVPVVVSVLLGFTLALISAFLPLWKIALVIGIAVCIYVGIESPEFVFLSSLFALPYIRFIPGGEIWLIAAVIFALGSFLLKVLYGKRIFYIEQYDIFLGIMLLFLLISGIFIKGEASFWGSLRMIALSVGYVIAGNIVANRRLAERSVNAIVISGVFSVIASLVQVAMKFIRDGADLSAESLSFILARQDGMAVFLIAAVLLSVVMIKQSNGISGKLYICSSIVLLIGLVISGEVFAALAAILGVLAYHILKNNLRPGIFLPLLLAVPTLILLLPNEFLNYVFTYSPSVVSAEKLIDLWNNSLKILSNNLLIGIGVGTESFAEEMVAIGVEGYPDSSNLFIELGLEAGIFALIAFMCIIFTRMKHRSLHYLYLRNSQIERLSCVCGACMLSLLAFGMVNYIWSEPATYYFFWCLFGIGSATLRVAKKDYDDKVIYYEESSAFDSSVIDIEIG